MAASGLPRLEGVINKHDAVPDKAILTNRHQFADKAMRLDACPVADRCIPLNFYKRPYKAIVSKGAAIQVDRLDHGYVFAKRNVNDAYFVNGWFTRVHILGFHQEKQTG